MLATFSLTSCLSLDASASGGMGMAGLGQAILVLIGVAALLLAAVLGVASWSTVLRPPTTVGWIFGRGFLGLSSVVAFAFGAIFVLVGTTSFAKGGFAGTGVFLVGLLICVFLAVEFAIAGALYRRSNQHKASTLAKLLSVVSYVFAGVFGLCAAGVLSFGLISALAAPTVHMNPQSKKYQEGCAANNGSDCNMLGLHYRTGEEGLPQDLAKAVESFSKACDLDTAIACRNLASHYRNADGVPRDRERADQLMLKYNRLLKQPDP